MNTAVAGSAPASATTFAELWAELKTESLNAWQTVKNDAVALEQKIVPVVEADISLGLAQFKSVAVSTVMWLANAEFANLTGAQKNSITINTIAQAALAAGKPIVQQDAAMLAQQAYNAVASTVGSAK